MFSLNDVGFLGSVSTYDADALAYIRAVEIADTQELEPGVRDAINAFVLGCKADGIWTAIKASCILAGARTLTGALVPLVGTAPTNFNFVSGDYSRETGLVGDASTKYLNSNRNNNADPQNNRHAAVVATIPSNETDTLIGARTPGTDAGSTELLHSTISSCVSNIDATDNAGATMPTNVLTFKGVSRSSSASYISRVNSGNYTITRTSGTPVNLNYAIFSRLSDLPPSRYSNARIAFYSIGESLDLALLDARVTTLINDFAAAI